MIKVLNARPADTFKQEIDFSDHTQGVFDAGTYLSTRSGPPVGRIARVGLFPTLFHRRRCAVLAQRTGNFPCTFA